MAGPGVKLEGIKEFAADLQALAAALPDAMAEGQRQIAEEVISGAKGIAGGAYLSSRAASTLRPSVSAKSAAVIIGDASVPWALGNEFGSNRYPQFRPWLGSGPSAGYALYPAIRAEAESGRLVERYAQMVDRVARRAFPT